ncbi:FecCD family ABC transporter permease [Streptococcus ferus]|uniref:FecCD family ABC transporter permease n=1 Tax=Streptococcus ferus TaxID=1345 RepID=UPI002355AFE6|nr:iron ABC transporter permease [Streptococcus ferus]
MNTKARLFSQKNKSNRLWLVFFIMLVLLLIGWYLSLRLGAVNYSHDQLLATLKHPFQDSNTQDVIIDLRLPRILAASLVGAAMAQAGAIMQGVTRNPIADPGLLGINAGAGLALILAYAFFGSLHYSLILLVCLIGSTLAAVLIFGLSYQPRKGYHQLRLILAGAMIATLFSALGQAVTLYFDLSTTVIGWQAGGLAQLNWNMLAVIAPIILIGLALSQLFAHQLTILSLDETVAKALGQATLTITMLLLGIVLLLSAASVALIGSIAFVGLIIPHFIGLFVAKDYRLLLPLTAFAGATFMIWVDLISRTINPPAETPINAIISIIGLPCFLWLIRKGKNL